MDVKAELKRLIEEVDVYEAATDLAVQYTFERETKRIAIPFTQAFIFQAGDFVRQERTYVNGAEDLYVDAICFTPIQGANNPNSLITGENGLSVLASGLGPQFDFEWNYRLLSTGAWYGSSANATLMLNRKSLGNQHRGIFHRFDYPLYFKAGDALSLWVKPFLTGIIPVYVNVYMWAHRTGQMADSAYDLLAEARKVRT